MLNAVDSNKDRHFHYDVCRDEKMKLHGYSEGHMWKVCHSAAGGTERVPNSSTSAGAIRGWEPCLAGDPGKCLH